MAKEREVDVWVEDEWEPAQALEQNGPLTLVQFDDGRVDWVMDFEVEDRNT